MGSQNPGQRQLNPFCIHARYEDPTCHPPRHSRVLYCQGLRRLLIVNGHGGNNFRNMIRDLAVAMPDFPDRLPL